MINDIKIDPNLRLLANDECFSPYYDTGKTPPEKKHFRESFRTTWLTLTEIGLHFDFSAIKTGKILTEMGLRDPDKSPSNFAIVNGFCWRVEESQYNGNPYYLWNAEKTIQAINDYLDPDNPSNY